MSSTLSDYEYDLPRELIAQRAPERRESSRMMVLRREERSIEHRRFVELKMFLRPGDLLVLNDTRVLAAKRVSSDGAVEFLFLERLGPTRWKCLVKPGRKMRVGATTKIGGFILRVERIMPDGERIIAFNEDFDPYAGGSMPLPPYINRVSDDNDTARYQTVFARTGGAAAAPTAGLHFTREILRLIPHTFVTLHVGPGTFLPDYLCGSDGAVCLRTGGGCALPYISMIHKVYSASQPERTSTSERLRLDSRQPSASVEPAPR